MADHHSLLPDEPPSSRRPLPDGFLARLEALGVAPQVHNSTRRGPRSRAVVLGVAACCVLIFTATVYYGIGFDPSEPQASTAERSTQQQVAPAADTAAVTQTQPADPPNQHAQSNEQTSPPLETGPADSLEQAVVKASAPPQPDATAPTIRQPMTAAADQDAGALNADPGDDIIDFSLPDLLAKPAGSGWNGQVFGHISGIDWPTVTQRNKTAARSAAAARQRRDSDTALIELLLRQSE